MTEMYSARMNSGGSEKNVLQRQQSFSSFPPSRSPSSISTRNDTKKGRSPQPPMVREDDVSDHSSRDSGLEMKKTRPTPKLRSQYPADSIENHVEYILVASFDIDRGSVMEHQYPGPISGDETMLAELMLPDQAHVRSQDWTIFFLHKDTSAEDEEREARKERRRKRRRKRDGLEEEDDATAGADEDAKEDEDDDFDDDSTDEESDDADDPDGPPLVYVLNLVNTKQDNTVKRYGCQTKGDHLLVADIIQRCDSESHGYMHSAFVPTHLQTAAAPRIRGIFSRSGG